MKGVSESHTSVVTVNHIRTCTTSQLNSSSPSDQLNHNEYHDAGAYVASVASYSYA